MAERTLPILNPRRPATNESVERFDLERAACGEQAREAFERIESLLLDGLRHGFFEISINCRLTQGRKRELIIRAGKSYQFTIPENEIPH